MFAFYFFFAPTRLRLLIASGGHEESVCNGGAAQSPRRSFLSEGAFRSTVRMIPMKSKAATGQ